MLKSILINLLFFIYPFYILIDGNMSKKLDQFGKIFLMIIMIVIIDNGIYNMKRARVK